LVRDNEALAISAPKSSATEQQLLQEKLNYEIERINSKSLVIKSKLSKSIINNELSSKFKNSVYSSGGYIIPTGELLFMPKKDISFEEVNKFTGRILEIIREKH
jgi:hypothetical protein